MTAVEAGMRLSEQKQAACRAYAKGEISLTQVAERIGKMQPPAVRTALLLTLTFAVVGAFVAVFLPPSARRQA